MSLLEIDGHFAGLFSNPAAIRHLPGPVNRSLPARSDMYPSPINRALCSAGMAAGGPFTAVLPTVRREANSCSLRRFDNLGAIPQYGPFPDSSMVKFDQVGVLSWQGPPRLSICP